MQLAKALRRISWTLSGMVMEASEVQLKKALSLMDLRLSGSDSEVRA